MGQHDQVVQWFDLGGEIQLSDNARPRTYSRPAPDSGLMEKLGKLNVNTKDSAEMQVSAAEFVLEGLHAHKKIDATKSVYSRRVRSQ